MKIKFFIDIFRNNKGLIGIEKSYQEAEKTLRAKISEESSKNFQQKIEKW